MPIYRVKGDAKGWSKNISSHPLVDTLQTPNNYEANQLNIESGSTDSKNTESFDVLVTYSSPNGSNIGGVAHQLLKPDDHSHGKGNATYLNSINVNV